MSAIGPTGVASVTAASVTRAADAPAGPPIVELVGATKRYGDQVALDDVSLQIEPGEFFCLLGPSGCGKTTTLNLIGGFIPLTSGELRIEGRRVNDLPPHKRNVNTVFQNYALFPHLTVAENVAFGLRMEGRRGSDVDRSVAEYLELVGLEAFASRMPGQLSGGQQQRVALARALVKRPAVLLLDEPLGALDLKLRKQMQVELSRIHRQVGTTFVFVTHDQGEALSMATRIAVMDRGHVIQVGSPRQVYYEPVDRFVADFIGEMNLLTGHGGTDAGRGAVRLADGSLVRSTGAGLPVAGGACSVMVRPECLSVGGEAPEGASSLRGRVVDIAFLGDHTRVTVRTSVGDLVSARWHADRPTSEALEGYIEQDVVVWWDPAESAILASGEDAATQGVDGRT